MMIIMTKLPAVVGKQQSGPIFGQTYKGTLSLLGFQSWAIFAIKSQGACRLGQKFKIEMEQL